MRRSKRCLFHLHVYWALPGASETKRRHVDTARYRYLPARLTPPQAGLHLSPSSSAAGGLRGSCVLVVAVLVGAVFAAAAYHFYHSQFESFVPSVLHTMYSS